MRVYGLGDPVMDIVSRVQPDLLERLGIEPGGCVPVTAAEMAALLALPEVQASMIRVPGGSAANVMKGVASLAQPGTASKPVSSAVGSGSGGGGGLEVLFVGMVGSDEVAEEYQRSIAAHGVQPVLLRSPTASGHTNGAGLAGEAAGSGTQASPSPSPTATCLCLVTPDGQRTMRTSLGAALELREPEQLPPPLQGNGTAPPAGSCGNGAGGPAAAAAQQEQQPSNGSSSGSGGGWALLHCEGYCLYRPAVTAAAMRAAHAAGARVSLDLASFEVIANCWGRLDSLLQEQLVDIVFCNEQEAEALCEAASLALPAGASPEQAAAAAQDYLLSRGATTAVVSLGSKGCSAKSAEGAHVRATASRVEVVDTIGAGDFFTAGFLFALLSGASLQACASSGCAAGSAAVQVAGAELGPGVLQQLRGTIAGILAAGAGLEAGAGGGAAAAQPGAVEASAC